MAARVRKIDRKIVVLGDSGAGKTALVQRYVHDVFREEYAPTIGAAPSKKTVELDGKTVNLVIWDVAGHISKLHPAFFSEAQGAVLVCDLTRNPGPDALKRWHDALARKVGKIPMVMAANKSDLVEMQECRGLDKTDYTIVPTSAKSGKNVEKLFNELVKRIA